MGVFEKAIISGEDILNYIPQREPIVMVDSFFGVENSASYSSLDVVADNIFVKNNMLDECGLIEHIAQSAALRVGYICKSEYREVPIGFIGSVDKMSIYSLPAVGDTIRTEIILEQEIMNISLISARVKHNDTLLAECKMKIYLKQ